MSMKQLRSGLKDSRNLFEEEVTVKSISESLRSCSCSDDAVLVRNTMQELDFDVMGIEEKGEVYGYVHRSDLGAGPCKKYQSIFHPSELVADSTSLMDVLRILHDNPRIFVLERNRVTGIVTRGDLQKAPVRMLLFGIITLLEMHLLRILRIYYEKASWQNHLSDNRLDYAKRIFEKRKSRNEDIGLADCLQFCDKTKLVLRLSRIREEVQKQCGKSAKTLLKQAEKMRDKLAHAQDIVEGSTWMEVTDLTGDIQGLLELLEHHRSIEPHN